MFKITRAAIVIGMIMAFAFPLCAQSKSSQYKYQVTPYFWKSGFDGNVGVLGRTATVDESFSDIWNNLKSAGMVTFEGKWDRWVFLGDVIYINLENTQSTPDFFFSQADVKVKTLILDPEFGYQFIHREGAQLNGLVGGRYWRLKNELEFTGSGVPSAEFSETRQWMDPIVGLQFRGDLSKSVYVTAKADIGGFSAAARLDWQAWGGVGYRFNDRISVMGGYRVLGVDYSKDGFLYDVTMQGILVGVGIRF